MNTWNAFVMWIFKSEHAGNPEERPWGPGRGAAMTWASTVYELYKAAAADGADEPARTEPTAPLLPCESVSEGTTWSWEPEAEPEAEPLDILALYTPPRGYIERANGRYAITVWRRAAAHIEPTLTMRRAA